jgi:hypothetical protein
MWRPVQRTSEQGGTDARVRGGGGEGDEPQPDHVGFWQVGHCVRLHMVGGTCRGGEGLWLRLSSTY